MVDDPSAHPDLFPTEKAQETERQRLFRIIEDLVLWKNTTNETVLQQARDEIWQSWRYTCAENADHPRAKELFDRHKMTAFHDPFAGGGSIPLEAQRLGLESHASDLNPVAVLINKALIEIPPKFAGQPPVNQEARRNPQLFKKVWKGAQGLAEDVRYYGQWMRDEAEKRIGHLYPKVDITVEMAEERPDLKPLMGQKLTVIAWLWARTVKSPNPAFAQVDVPLASGFMLSTKPGKEYYVEPVIKDGSYRFMVKVGKAKDTEAAQRGTKSGSSGSSFLCLMSGTPMPFDYVRQEAKNGRMGARLMAIVADGGRSRIYLSPTRQMEEIALSAQPQDVPETELPEKALGFRIQEYGMTRWCDLFTARQLVTLTTFSDIVQEARGRVQRDALAAGLPNDDRPLSAGGTAVTAYADAVSVYLGLIVSKQTVFLTTQARWRAGEGKSAPAFGRQALPMVWDFADLNPFAGASGDFLGIVEGAAKTLLNSPPPIPGSADQCDSATQKISVDRIVSTDPPYYDNISYADFSDYFYVWLRRSLKSIFPGLFATLAVPKAEEMIASPYRHGNKEQAESFFLSSMTQAMHRLAKQTHLAFPITIYYAFKQSETDDIQGTSSTGWDTFLDAMIRAGLVISGTWPLRTENDSRLRGQASNALASSILIVCRPISESAAPATRGQFVNALKAELPVALAHLQRGNIAPVDLAQAAIGPGMAVYTRYARVLDAQGKPLSVRDALALINQTLDEALAEQEGDFDADSRWALAWFDHVGFAEGEYGMAETLSTAKNTSLAGLVEAGIVVSGRGKVRLLKPEELPADWDPATDKRLTHWETVQQLIRVLAISETAAAALVARLGDKAEPARELCYRLYTLCERKKRAPEALAYNGLVLSWPEITRLARGEVGKPRQEQSTLFDESED
jgi:putative DNA methylase